MNIKKIKNIIKYLIKAKFVFFKPKKTDLLIFDYMGSNNFIKYIKQYNYDILHIRGEKINLFIVLKCLLNLTLNYKKYINYYIIASNPKLIITFIDNNFFFYQLKNYHSKVKTLFVQNGLRSHYSDIFGNKNFLKNKKELRVDYMLVANKTIGKKYNRYIKGKTVPIGYFKNNIYSVKNKIKKKEILYISTHRNFESNKKIYKNYTWLDFIKNDERFFQWLNIFCNSNKIKINILGRSSKFTEAEKEKNYFDNFFSKYKFIIGSKNPYKIIDNYEYVVTNDSTLGIENLARNGKTAFICNRINNYPFITRKFGWMEDFPSYGFCWTYFNNKNEFSRVMKNLIYIKKKNWLVKMNANIKKIVLYDKYNKKFSSIITKILNAN